MRCRTSRQCAGAGADGTVDPVLCALVNLRLGQEAAAIAAAERALELGYPRALFTVDPLLESVRNSPRLAVGGYEFQSSRLLRNGGFQTRLATVFP